MKAAVYHRYGSADVVRVEELPTPTPGPDEILIRIRATTVSSGDFRLRSLTMPAGFGLLARPVFGFFRPRKPVLGTEFAGTVAAVGAAVRAFKEGDSVFGFPGIDLGCHAEFRTMPANGNVLTMPAGLSFEEAASLSFGGTTALHYLRTLGNVQPGERLLVLGASGTVGSAAVQIGKHFGAVVTGVTSTGNIDRVRACGADAVIDYKKTDFTTSGGLFDVIFDTVGATSFGACEKVLSDNGRLLLAAGSLWQLLGAGWISLTKRKRVLGGPAPESREDLRTLKTLAETGAFRPLIDRCYDLSDIAAAHAYVETGRKRGSVVIVMDAQPA